jgi:hypothetical protein
MSIPERRLLLSINAAKSLINPVAKQPESEPMIGPAATYQMADLLSNANEVQCSRAHCGGSLLNRGSPKAKN